MNPTVMRLTARTLLGHKRFWLLLSLSAVLVVLAVLVRVLTGTDDGLAWTIASGLGLSTLVPLIALLAGTGSIGPEIDDGAIIYLLSKPISRFIIVGSKLAVAVVSALVLGAVPVVVAAVALAEHPARLGPPLALGATVAVLCYCALFLMLAILTRHAVIVGLLYAVVWETTIANLIPGAQALSVRQWSLALAQWVLGTGEAERLGVDAAVGTTAGLIALVVLTVASTVYAGMRLRTLRLLASE
ncbi:MAG: ABC transporter permease subunit [Kineosporiaceae bacterium]|nr:ABC transporter permease subunit [Kineosporiaceae bacterium]